LGDVVPYKHFKFRNDLKTVINLECPILKEGNPEEGKINLKVQENYLGDIFGDNLFCVNIGNNHILDYGLEGLHSTINELNGLKTHYFGLNDSVEFKNDPLIATFGDISIGFISAVCISTSPILKTSGTARLSELDSDVLVAEIARLRQSVNRIVVYLHWGREESSYPEAEEIETARRLIDNGADVVVGSHAHAPQAIERYNKGIIAYNLGNFIMPALKNVPTYFANSGEPQSTFNKRTMPWNRISWGLAIDMGSLDYSVRKYMFVYNRVVKLLITPFDRYLRLSNSMTENIGSDQISRHLKGRALYRRLMEFIFNPHVPNKIKRLL